MTAAVLDPRQGLNVEIPFKSAEIHILSDVHIGAATHDAELFGQAIHDVASKSSARAILNGDLLEFIISGGRISIRDQVQHRLEEQVIQAAEILQPIRRKILFARTGNHEQRTVQRAEFDAVRLLCKMLQVPYYEGAGFTRIATQERTTVLAGGHGRSGAKNGDTELEKLRRIYEADVYYLGHSHHLYAKPVPIFYCASNGTEHCKEQWFVRAGSFLKYAGYARNTFLEPQRTGWAVISIKGENVACSVRTE